MSLVAYYALGGRARSVAPSDRIGPGAFARLRHSLPALRGSMVCSTLCSTLSMNSKCSMRGRAARSVPSTQKGRMACFGASNANEAIVHGQALLKLVLLFLAVRYQQGKGSNTIHRREVRMPHMRGSSKVCAKLNALESSRYCDN
jgi:hypothetical protein